MGITLVNVKHQDVLQNLYEGLYHQLVDISDLPGINTICAKETVETIRNRFDIISRSAIHFLGNGNFHYLTLPLLQKYKHPFSLIVFDHHNDAGKLDYEGFTSCGSWINEVVKLVPAVKKVFLVGCGEENDKEMSQEITEKIIIIPERELNPLKLYQVSKMIPTKDIYFSVDRDVLTPKEVQTNWDQGNVSTEELIDYIKILSNDHALIGADICGDLDWDYNMSKEYKKIPAREQAYHVNKQLFETFETILKKTETFPSEQQIV
ncbi:arginase family protein [Desemzia sp. C1]|uniref:arginase family protein n=1 Tax=Desemzia sp. C1 TaxID=2892016 RepID=UPI001E31AD3C|nr:arginase family protein [Desemzia sp. C1]MCI3027906.1 arginase family protein [Desemzia sp. C1]